MNAADPWRRPSPTVLIWLTFLLVLSFAPQRAALIGADGDPCWHWAQGNWMLAHHQVLRADPFSHTRPGAPLIEMWWLSELGYALAGNALGWNGVVLLSAALIATTLALLCWEIQRETGDPRLALAATLLAAAACASHWLARPHLLTHLLTVIFAWTLREHYLPGRQPMTPPRASLPFLILPPLMLLWANLHGAFVTGLVLLGVYMLGAAIEWLAHFQSGPVGAVSNRDPAGILVAFGTQSRARFPNLLLLFVVCLLASLVNPNGWRLHAHVLDYLRSPVLVGFVAEYAPPNFHDPAQCGFLLVLLVLVLVLARTRLRFTTTELLLSVVFGCLALTSVRNIPTFALIVIPILAGHVSTLTPGCARVSDPALPSTAGLQRRPGRPSVGLSAGSETRAQHLPPSHRTDSPPPTALAGWLWIPVVLATTLVVVPRWLETELPASRYPVAAVRFLAQHPETVHGEMFNDIIWGGYFVRALPDHQVFIDGRIDFYGEPLLRDFNVIDDVTPGWEAMCARYHVGWTILPVRHALNAVLAIHPQWREVYRDDVAIIYTRRAP